MAATNQDLVQLFALAGITVTISQLTRVRDWLKVYQGFESDPVPDDLIKVIHGYLRQQTLSFEREQLEKAVQTPTW